MSNPSVPQPLAVFPGIGYTPVVVCSDPSPTFDGESQRLIRNCYAEDSERKCEKSKPYSIPQHRNGYWQQQDHQKKPKNLRHNLRLPEGRTEAEDVLDPPSLSTVPARGNRRISWICWLKNMERQD
jgi:hypothetical protein